MVLYNTSVAGVRVVEFGTYDFVDLCTRSVTSVKISTQGGVRGRLQDP